MDSPESEGPKKWFWGSEAGRLSWSQLMENVEHQTKEFASCHTTMISVGENQTLRDQLEVIVVTQVWNDKNLS